MLWRSGPKSWIEIETRESGLQQFSLLNVRKIDYDRSEIGEIIGCRVWYSETHTEQFGMIFAKAIHRAIMGDDPIEVDVREGNRP